MMRALATRGRGALTVALALTGWATGASASLMSARLRWQPSPGFGVVGYRGYRLEAFLNTTSEVRHLMLVVALS